MVLFPPAATAQRPAMDAAWKPMLVHEGVTFSYIFYREADEANGGVVVRLDNGNPYPVRYRFAMVFRAENGDEHTERAEGTLRPGELKTGDVAGLFWIPFTDGRSIAEIGLRGYRVTPLPESK